MQGTETNSASADDRLCKRTCHSTRMYLLKGFRRIRIPLVKIIDKITDIVKMNDAINAWDR